MVVLLAGCGTTGSDDPVAEPQPTPIIDTSDESTEAVAAYLADLARQKDAARKRGEEDEAERIERRMREIERAQDAAFEAEDPQSEYDRALDALPMREPPLYVRQLVVDGTHELVVRVAPRRFFCGRSPDERLAAVRSYHEQADAIMREAGVEDFSIVVDGLRETAAVRPLATARRGKVSLTARGRGSGPC